MGDETFDYPTMARALILGDRDTVARKTREGLDLSLDPKVLIFKGLIPGMDVVGEKFRRNEYYVPQVLLSARAMYAGLDLLKPLITASARAGDYLGVVVIGTAQGDLHDIGKNLVAMMLEGAGFKVVNLGRDVAPEVFVKAGGWDVLERVRAGERLVFDGGYGTMLFAAGLANGACPELWNDIHADVVRAIHQGYFDAGSQIVETNTFGGTRLKLDEYRIGDRTRELNAKGARLARA